MGSTPLLRATIGAALALATLVELAGAAGAAPGTRVRVTLLERAPAESLAVFGGTPGERIVGDWQRARPGAFVLHGGAGPADSLVVPRALVASFEMSAGRHGRTGRGALIGTLVGAAAGLAFGQWFTEDENIDAGQGQGTWVGAFGLGGALGGLGLGALVGSLVRTEEWRPAPLPPDPPPSGR